MCSPASKRTEPGRRAAARRPASAGAWLAEARLAGALAALGLPACADTPPPTAPAAAAAPGERVSAAVPRPPAGVVADGAAADAAAAGAAAGALPIAGTVATPTPAVDVTQTGPGPAAAFRLTNQQTLAAAVEATASGPFSPALHATAAGPSGNAAVFDATSADNASPAVLVWTPGRTGLFVHGTGRTTHGASVVTSNVDNPWPALFAGTRGTGPAAQVAGAARGLYVRVGGGGPGVQVAGGTAEVVVPAPDGARSLYAEHAAEVWCVDYGFGRLAGAPRVWVPLDPAFAAALSRRAAYHVFVQPYADAELYVSRRTPEGFEVARRAGDPAAEFSYRVAGVRRGFEGRRLERAPWADGDVQAGAAAAEAVRRAVAEEAPAAGVRQRPPND